jgi:hypothetical protein
VAAAHAAELLTDAEIDAEIEQPDLGIDGGNDTSGDGMGVGRNYYKKGHYTNDPT